VSYFYSAELKLFNKNSNLIRNGDDDDVDDDVYLHQQRQQFERVLTAERKKESSSFSFSAVVCAPRAVRRSVQSRRRMSSCSSKAAHRH